MKFRGYSLRNVFSIEASYLDLSNEGLTLITGYSVDEGSSNGSGKSSLVNKGLLWALFGQTAEGHRSESVINRFVPNAEAIGMISIEDSDNTYTINRKRNKKHSSLEVWNNGSLISPKDIRETQELINKIIGRDLKTFIQTEFFGQGNSTPFLKLTPKAQKEILESILPFDELNSWIGNAKRARKLVEEHLNNLNIEYSKLGTKLETLKQTLENAMKESKSWEHNRDSTILQLNVKIESIKSDSNYKRIKEIESYLETSDLKRIESDISKEKKYIDNVVKLINEIKERLDHTKKERVKIEDKLKRVEGKCPTCLQPWIDDTLPTKDYLEKELLKNQSAISRFKAIIENYTFSVTTAENSLESFDKEYKKVSSLNDELIILKDSKDSNSLKELETKVESLKKEKNPFINNVETIEKSIQETDNLVTNQAKEIETINKEKEIVDFWEKAYGVDIRNLLFNRVCPFLEERANKHLRGLNNEQISVSFSMDKTLKSGDVRNDLSIEVKSATGGDSYGLLSGGEQQMVDFSIGLSLSELANTQVKSSTNLLILDEPFVGLDSRNSENIVNYLREEVSKYKDTILLVSNEEVLKGLIPHQIEVRKYNGKSEVHSK